MIVFCSYYTHLKSIILAKIRNIAKTTERAQIPQSEADIPAPPYGKEGRLARLPRSSMEALYPLGEPLEKRSSILY